MDQTIRITWGLRDGRVVTVRSTPAIARTVTELAESLGALWIQHPPGTGSARRLWIRDGPVQSIQIEPELN